MAKMLKLINLSILVTYRPDCGKPHCFDAGRAG
jgi:hypothetical protein